MALEPFLLPPSPLSSVDDYRAFGGGRGLARARELGPEQTIQEIQLSGLRGRGGAGFRTGRKWDTLYRVEGTRKYVVCNAAEGEPGTFKDRTLMRTNPYQIIEGLAVAAATIGAREAFICLKTKFQPEVERVTKAVAEMEQAGLTGDLVIAIVQGPDEYLYGEEKAMLEVIEGKAPLPRLFQPYELGLFATSPQMGWEAAPADPEAGLAGVDPDRVSPAETNPTLVNNAETLANIPQILARGPEWHRSMGTPDSPGHVICTVVGDTERAGVAEIELGTPLAEAIDRVGGGVRAGHRVKAVLSGVSNSVVVSDELATPLSYEAMAEIGSGLGSVGLIVYDEQACMVNVAHEISRFLYVESCGQCPPCKFGTGEITAYLERLLALQADDRDIRAIGERLQTVSDGNRCAIPLEERAVIASFLRSFPEEFADHLEGRPCSGRHDIPLAKIVDIDDGVAVYDLRQRLKLPDWTYPDRPGEGD
ncbi:MAG TPA: NADH-ubiquinone oxidoreductase-F iron-sulfur binding region domain-containing protein [Acidimicrobiales bacterium]|nr:NADH-ubiquinone oxidoreductase-F iron-sulfur binding region domain-containing protein [Acidimicrobiales bacterium]